MRWKLTVGSPGFTEGFNELLSARKESSTTVDKAVAEILVRVQSQGDAALFDLTEKFDQLNLREFTPTGGSLRLLPEAIEQEAQKAGKAEVDALKLAARRITSYHEKQLPADLDYHDDVGLRLGAWWRPVASAGIYVPGGTAAYPSSLLMNCIPALVAGVERIAVAVPAPDGQLSPLVMAAARLLDIQEIYLLGGAQAIAALAYGSESLEPVDVIAGPGRDFVASAKRQVFGQVGIDMIAGPSEVLIISDGKSPPDWVAMDLLSQAEHDPLAQALLICTSWKFANRVEAELEKALTRLPRSDIARKSLQNLGAIIVAPVLDEALPLIDALAPEHLEIMLDDEAAYKLGRKVRNAGSIFLGRYTPEALGDYLAGPNHVLPTSRTARFASGLSVLNFIKRSSFLAAGRGALEQLGSAGQCLARAEGLEAHALSLSLREGTPDG